MTAAELEKAAIEHENDCWRMEPWVEPTHGKSFTMGALLVIERCKRLEQKVQKLKALMLLTDPVVSGVIVSEIEGIQWNEFIKCFPDEGKNYE